MLRRWWPAFLLVMTFTLTACIGAVDRADFAKEVVRRGNGITSRLADDALTAFARQFPDGRVTRLRVGPGYVTVAVPVGPGAEGLDLDGYQFDYGARSWRDTGPELSLRGIDTDAELFDPLAVTGLRQLTELVDTTVAKSRLVGAAPTGVYVDNAAVPQRRIRVDVVSPRGQFAGQFTLEGVYIDGERG